MSLKEAQVWPKWSVDIDEGGKLRFAVPDIWEQFKRPFHGKQMVLILKKPTKNRSRQEEKYYYAVVVRLVAEAMEVSREAAHELMAKMFLTIEEKSPGGFKYRRVLSTTELGDKAYRDYWGKCVHWAALPTGEDGLNQDSGLSLYIPFPNEVDYESSM